MKAEPFAGQPSRRAVDPHPSHDARRFRVSALRQLIRSIEPAVGNSCAFALWIYDASYLRLERAADFVEQRAKCGIMSRLRNTRGVRFGQIAKIGFERMHFRWTSLADGGAKMSIGHRVVRSCERVRTGTGFASREAVRDPSSARDARIVWMTDSDNRCHRTSAIIPNMHGSTAPRDLLLPDQTPRNRRRAMALCLKCSTN